MLVVLDARYRFLALEASINYLHRFLANISSSFSLPLSLAPEKSRRYL
jgi:hypothetical protein